MWMQYIGLRTATGNLTYWRSAVDEVVFWVVMIVGIPALVLL